MEGYEIFYMSQEDILSYGPDSCFWYEGVPLEKGWYYWACLPGYLPTSDPWGPFETEKEALNDINSW